MGLLFILSFSAVALVFSCAAVSSKSSTGWGDYFRAVEDHWTWVTVDGRSYEGVEIQKIEADEIVLHHRDGFARLAISSLSDESRKRLAQTSAWHHQSESPAPSTISPEHFAAAPVAGGFQAA